MHQHIYIPSPKWTHQIDQSVARNKAQVAELATVYSSHRSECSNRDCCVAHLVRAVRENAPDPSVLGTDFLSDLSSYILRLESNLAMAVRLLHEERISIADTQ
jgi:hypothetical protein